MKRAFVYFGFLSTAIFVSNVALAQVFGGETSAQSSTPSFQAEKAKTQSPAANAQAMPSSSLKKSAPTAQPASATQANTIKQEAQSEETSSTEETLEEEQAASDTGENFIPTGEMKAPVLPENVQTRSVAGPGHVGIERETEDNGGIFFYYTDFYIDRSIEDMISCSIRFVLYTTLSQKLTNISLRLTWPNLSTKLSFNDVQPENNYYKNYTFFGSGCYSMDKLPNVTINRCRLKGKSQQQCANLFHLTEE